MKTALRRMAALTILAPGLIWTYLLSLLIGKKRAIALCGPFFTAASKPFARNWLPRIENAADFDHFSSRMRKGFRFWEPFFDFSVVEDNRDVFKLRITYCPFCDVIQTIGLPDLAPFVCEADWQVARENEDKWIFRRQYQLSTGDAHCDHTYIRKTGFPAKAEGGNPEPSSMPDRVRHGNR